MLAEHSVQLRAGSSSVKPAVVKPNAKFAELPLSEGMRLLADCAEEPIKPATYDRWVRVVYPPEHRGVCEINKDKKFHFTRRQS